MTLKVLRKQLYTLLRAEHERRVREFVQGSRRYNREQALLCKRHAAETTRRFQESCEP